MDTATLAAAIPVDSVNNRVRIALDMIVNHSTRERADISALKDICGTLSDPSIDAGGTVYVDYEDKSQPGVSSSCTLSVRPRLVHCHFVDQSGDIYDAYRMEVTVNYPAHGSADPQAVQHRLKLISSVNDLAMQIYDAIGKEEFKILIFTANENAWRQAEIAARKQHDRIVRDLELVVRGHCSGMRVNAVRKLPVEAVTNVPDGCYLVRFGGPITSRSFAVDVSRDGGEVTVILKRVA